MSATIHTIRYVLGEPRPIERLTPNNPRLISAILEDRMNSYRECREEPSFLGAQAFEMTLRDSRCDVHDIDAVLYCSTGRINDRPTFATRCLERNLIADAPIIGICLNECANLAPALRIARDLIEHEGLRNVAVVTADCVSDNGERLAQFGSAILSDGAAAFIISAPRPDAWHISSFAHAADHRLQIISRDEEHPLLLLRSSRQVRNIVHRVLHEMDFGPQHIAQIVTTNLRTEALNLLISRTGLSTERVFSGTVRSIAHTFAADPVINLAEYWASLSGEKASGPILLLCLSPFAWGAAILTPPTGGPL